KEYVYRRASRRQRTGKSPNLQLTISSAGTCRMSQKREDCARKSDAVAAEVWDIGAREGCSRFPLGSATRMCFDCHVPTSPTVRRLQSVSAVENEAREVEV